MGRAGGILRASALVEVTGAEPERLLNALTDAGMGFSGVESLDGCTMRLTLRGGDLAAARSLAARCQCELRVVKRTGAPAFRRKIRRRVALMAALSLCFAALAASSLFVWEIEVQGNERVRQGRYFARWRTPAWDTAPSGRAGRRTE